MEPFFRAQISAAKIIQYRHRADWLASGALPSGEPPDLVGVVRPALLALGAALTESIRAYLSTGARFSESQRELFHARIGVEQLDSRDKDNLFDSLAGIRLTD